jgi:outer membrane protein assembly factor BamB
LILEKVMKLESFVVVIVSALLLPSHWLVADDWTRFRGPNGSGVSAGDASTPVEWSDTNNLKWKTELPGPGLSSPIVVGDRVFVTCWTGYGLDQRNPGSPEDLERHLLCIDRESGDVLWQKSVKAKLPEDVYSGMFAENGYASHTPVSDGNRVYAFFGKSGVYAYDLEGNELWSADVGSDLDQRKWGSASSPILYKNLLIVPAVVESHSLVALSTDDGSQVWKQEAEGFGNCWSTPILAENGDGEDQLIMAVPGEIWALDPDDGTVTWYSEGPPSDSMCSSVIAVDGVAYAMETGPRGGGTVAVRIGGSGDVTQSNTVWKGSDRNRIGTPVAHDGRIYWISNKIANCINANDGSKVYQERLDSSGGAPPSAAPQPGRRGGGRRGPGGQDYSSPVVADGKLYYAARDGTVFVIELGPEFKLLAKNKFTDSGEISSTPAISDGQIFVRSSKSLYCIVQAD